jgi:hypothetical protein
MYPRYYPEKERQRRKPPMAIPQDLFIKLRFIAFVIFAICIYKRIVP